MSKGRADIKQIEKYEIDMNSNLGKGQFGAVKSCIHINDPTKILACKIIVRSSLNSALQVHLQNEV